MSKNDPTVLHNAKPGEVMEGRPRTLSLARILAFSGGPFDRPGWPHRNLHTDKKLAQQVGLPDIIASGTQSEGILVGFLISFCGPDWHKSGSLDLRFIKSVAVNELIYPRLRIIEKLLEADSERVSFDAWCENEAGDPVIVGHASCMFPIAGIRRSLSA